MQLAYIDENELYHTLKASKDNSVDFIILITGALKTVEPEAIQPYLDESIRVLKGGGILFVQGVPERLPEPGVYLDKRLTFKYWFVVESALRQRPPTGLPSVHAAALLFTKGKRQFKIKRTRLPHHYCLACHRTLKDWGGKAHLMHPDGYVISDVIKDMPPADNYTGLSKPLLDILLQMLDVATTEKEPGDGSGVAAQPELIGLVGPAEGLAGPQQLVETLVQYTRPGFRRGVLPAEASTPSPAIRSPAVGDELFNVVHQGDAVEILRQYPDESIDLVFADPPYNLDKGYNVYDDERAEEQYINWCNRWLTEYIRLLKPTGSLYLLNLPRWAMYHAAFLNQQLYFQNWIAWDALSEPRGKVMPAHYALLFYTKHPTDFTFNYHDVSPIDDRRYCLRTSCIRARKAAGNDLKVPLTDIWWDVHRIKHQRDRDHHPCQLPDSLLHRLIKLSTQPGDVVLDALGGSGTTPIAAIQLGRRYVAIDIDPYYAQMMRQKIAQVEQAGYVPRQSIKKPARQATKKALQLELRQIALELGRLPMPEDVKERSQYELDIFFEMFPTWGKALKAAKVVI